jgi:cytochrome c
MNILRLCAAAAFALAVAVPSSVAAPLEAGEALLTRDCARCHAIGLSGSSPRPDAPAFRTLGARYPIESLEEALGEGIMSGHPDMPELKYDADEVGVIIDFLNSIQAR